MADQDSKKRKVRNLEDVDFDELIGTDRHPQPRILPRQLATGLFTSLGTIAS